MKDDNLKDLPLGARGGEVMVVGRGKKQGVRKGKGEGGSGARWGGRGEGEGQTGERKV